MTDLQDAQEDAVTSHRAEVSSEEDLEPAARAFLTASRALIAIAIRSVGAAPVPLTVPQMRLLVLVATDGRRVGTVAEDLGVNQSNASRLVDRLERQGLVTRAPDPQDGRASLVQATEAGHRALDSVDAHRLDALRSVLGRMDADQRAGAVQAILAFDAAARES